MTAVRAGRASPPPPARARSAKFATPATAWSAPKCAAPPAKAILAMSFPTGRDRRGCAFASTARRLTSPGAGRKRRGKADRPSGRAPTGGQRGKGNGIAPRKQAEIFGEIDRKKRRDAQRGCGGEGPEEGGEG